jgi:hypothetical protein
VCCAHGVIYKYELTSIRSVLCTRGYLQVGVGQCTYCAALAHTGLPPLVCGPETPRVEDPVSKSTPMCCLGVPIEMTVYTAWPYLQPRGFVRVNRECKRQVWVYRRQSTRNNPCNAQPCPPSFSCEARENAASMSIESARHKCGWL